MRPKRFVATCDFSVDGRTYRAGDLYVPDRHFARLTRWGFVAPKRTTKQGESNGNG